MCATARRSGLRILLTNDDGIKAAGLLAVAQALVATGHDLAVAAPAGDCSGTGSGLPGIEAIAVGAPPSIAVLAGCTGVFGVRPDLVVKRDQRRVQHRTSRAFVEHDGRRPHGGGVGVRAVVVSAGFAPRHRIDTAAEVRFAIVGWMVRHGRPRTMLNVNVPNLATEQLWGVQFAPLAHGGLMDLHLHLQRMPGALRLERYENTERLGVDTDSALASEGSVAISMLTPVSAILIEGTAVATPVGDPAASVEAALRLSEAGRRTTLAGTSC